MIPMRAGVVSAVFSQPVCQAVVPAADDANLGMPKQKCQVIVREDLEHRVTTWAITAFISENPSMRAHCLTH